ncbi:MAG TPA: 50S ribosomal protein L15 [Ktedonobacter sp.]|nr:50S ribosomal protein L15 [Ktedonobacter sp.]HAG99517.1 50S ribosomal protein L15 [Ktedonobacter sp.]HAT43819.1 50S ribosomal protein L15 [Ktedonobacter sp.]HBE24662.1 50S ribosomal protein L15 [Ktedonobacter sp.]HBE28832.1 50S ribosomal protein L15 [Ktedonobacter sp.]
MKLSDLRPAPGSHKVERRVGRGHGSGRGKTAGRGTKGQKARTGGHIHRAFEGGQTRLVKRLPFVRGLGNSNTPFRKNYAIIDLTDLARFDAATQVSPEQLVEQKLITPAQGRGLVKVLGNGEVNHALKVRVHKVSAGARAKIEAAGGTVEIIPTKVYEKTKRSKNQDTKAPTGQAQSTRK